MPFIAIIALLFAFSNDTCPDSCLILDMDYLYTSQCLCVCSDPIDSAKVDLLNEACYDWQGVYSP